MQLSDIDKNFLSNHAIDAQNTVFYNVLEAPFCIHGLLYEDGHFRRMPDAVAKTVSDGVYSLHTTCAGGRVRFVTNSPFVVVRCQLDNVIKAEHLPVVASAGFDMYEDNVYSGTFRPPFAVGNSGFMGCLHTPRREERTVTINFPYFSSVTELYIGLSKDAALRSAADYALAPPVVFYGSSITHGGCASRPGMIYPAQISRRFDMDFINLGFSGSAKAEDAMADYINTLSMRAFVYDYDHNAPDAEFLQKTHEPFFQKIRRAHPSLPIVIVSMPMPIPMGASIPKRRDIVKQTYLNAKAQGDDAVYFVDGLTLLESSDCTVDGTHPTDLGFYYMAQKIGDALKIALSL